MHRRANQHPNFARRSYAGGLSPSAVAQCIAVAEALPVKRVKPIVIPARGGIGERVEYQANVTGIRYGR